MLETVESLGAFKDNHGGAYAGYATELLKAVFCVSHVL